MPGLTLWMTSEPQADDAARFEASQRTMLHTAEYRANQILIGPRVFLGYVKYAEYPVTVIRHNGRIAYFEGRIYSHSAAKIDASLRSLLDELLPDFERAAERIGSWIREFEGEYVVALADEKSESVAVFTDPLARLTTYLHRDDSTVLISRECKFIQNLKKRPGFDRIGWAELLCLNHLLGRRTLFENIESAPTGMLFTCRRNGQSLKTELTSLYTTNLDEKDAPGKSIKNYAAEMVDLWLEKCQTWGTNSGTTKNVISLSGGKDSRVVAGVLSKLGIPYVAATFNDAYGVANPDVVASEALAKAMNMDWRLFLLEKPTAEQTEFLVKTTDGINPVANAAVIPFLEIIVREWGRGVMYITGDGGDFIFPDLRLSGNIKTIDDVVRVFLGFNPAATPACEAEDIMGLQRGTLAEELRSLLMSYPERDVMQKAIHYRGYERGQNWVYSGEERARFFLWQSTPHYFFPIFEKAMRIPDHLKANDALCVEFMKVLSPQWAAVREANYGLPLTSRLRPLKMKIKHFALDLPIPIRESVRFLLKGRRRPFIPPKEVLAHLRQRLVTAGALGSIMCAEAVYRRLEKMSRYEFENFYTLAILERLSRMRHRV